MDSRRARLERAGFCDRLTSALKQAGYSLSPSALVREFNLRGDGATVTVHGARKWLMGDAIPTHERVQVLSHWLGVSPQWLRYGEEPYEQKHADGDSGGISPAETVLLGDFRRLDEDARSVVTDLIRSLLAHPGRRK